MALLFWKKNKEIDNFAHNMANHLYSQITAEDANQFFLGSNESLKSIKKTNKKQQHINQLLQDTAIKVIQFKKQHKIGIYGKARLHLAFKTRLAELGYAESVSNQINQFIMFNTP